MRLVRRMHSSMERRGCREGGSGLVLLLLVLVLVLVSL